jgi:hypothetical protein
MQPVKKSYIPQKLIWDIMPEPEWLSHKMDNYSASVTKSGPTAQPESVNSDLATSSSLASAVQDSSSQLEPTAGYKLRRSTRISKPPQRFKPYAKPEHINSVLATNCTREYKGHHDGDPTSNFGEPSATPSTQPRAEVKESECFPSASKASEYGAVYRLDEQSTGLSKQGTLGAMEVDCTPRHATASDCGASTNEFVTHDEGTLDDSAQRIPPRPGMDRDPSAPLETSISARSMVTTGNDTTSGNNVSGDSGRDDLCDINCRFSKEPADAYRRPQDPPDYVHLPIDEPTAMPVVAISSTDEDLIETIRTHLIRADVDYAIDLDAWDIYVSLVYSKIWKEPDKKDAQVHELKEELDSALRRSIERSGKLSRNTAVQRCSSGQRHDLPGPEPTTEPVTSYLGAPEPSVLRVGRRAQKSRSTERA